MTAVAILSPQPTATRSDQSLVTSVRVWEAHCSCDIWGYFYRERGPPTLFHNENKGTGGNPWIKMDMFLWGKTSESYMSLCDEGKEIERGSLI